MLNHAQKVEYCRTKDKEKQVGMNKKQMEFLYSEISKRAVAEKPR